MSNGVAGDHEQLLRQQTILAQFGELALRSDELDEILTEACRLVGEALGTDFAKVVELQEDGKTLLVRAGVGWKAGVVGVATIEIRDDTSEGQSRRPDGGSELCDRLMGDGEFISGHHRRANNHKGRAPRFLRSGRSDEAFRRRA